MNVQHKRWFPERKEAESELFGVFQANANMLCSLAVGGWAHTALSCRTEKEYRILHKKNSMQGIE